MKKALTLTLILTLLFTVFSLSLSAFGFGTGIAVIANDVKMIKTGLLGQRLSFTETDFKTALSVPSFDKITVTSLPDSEDGVLMLGDRRLSEGASVRRKNISSLSFTPASSEVSEAYFEFSCDSYAGGGSIGCTLKFIDKINYGPTVEGISEETLSYTTQREISVYGELCAKDKEGDGLEFIIVSYPKNGSLTTSGDGGASFRYTPNDGFSGNDSFVYVARDEYGNFSRCATVNLKITERISEIVYVDMLSSPAYNAAVAMTGMGIMSGYRLGDDMYFDPDATVTRAEFVAMAMKAVGISVDKSRDESFFDDDSSIPKSLAPYVAAAQREGIINGSFDGKGLYFRPNDAITNCEAAIIMANLLEISDVSAGADVANISSVPVFARGQYGAMYQAGIFSRDGIAPKDTVTRGVACEYLYRLSAYNA